MSLDVQILMFPKRYIGVEIDLYQLLHKFVFYVSKWLTKLKRRNIKIDIIDVDKSPQNILLSEISSI